MTARKTTTPAGRTRAASGSAGTAIDAIEPLPRDPNLRRVRIGRRVVATLSADAVEALGLRPGRRWTPALERSVHEATAREAAHVAALRLLGRGAMASARLAERLERAGHEPAIAARVVAELAEAGWLDDRAFAVAVAEGILRRGPASAAVLARRLRGRGIDAALAADVAGRHGSDGIHAVVELARRHAARQRGTPLQTARRIAAALARRGIEDGTIRQALRRLGLPDGDEWDA